MKIEISLTPEKGDDAAKLQILAKQMVGMVLSKEGWEEGLEALRAIDTDKMGSSTIALGMGNYPLSLCVTTPL